MEFTEETALRQMSLSKALRHLTEGDWEATEPHLRTLYPLEYATVWSAYEARHAKGWNPTENEEWYGEVWRKMFQLKPPNIKYVDRFCLVKYLREYADGEILQVVLENNHVVFDAMDFSKDVGKCVSLKRRLSAQVRYYRAIQPYLHEPWMTFDHEQFLQSLIQTLVILSKTPGQFAGAVLHFGKRADLGFHFSLDHDGPDVTIDAHFDSGRTIGDLGFVNHLIEILTDAELTEDHWIWCYLNPRYAHNLEQLAHIAFLKLRQGTNSSARKIMEYVLGDDTMDVDDEAEIQTWWGILPPGCDESVWKMLSQYWEDCEEQKLLWCYSFLVRSNYVSREITLPKNRIIVLDAYLDYTHLRHMGMITNLQLKNFTKWLRYDWTEIVHPVNNVSCDVVVGFTEPKMKMWKNYLYGLRDEGVLDRNFYQPYQLKCDRESSATRYQILPDGESTKAGSCWAMAHKQYHLLKKFSHNQEK